MYVLSDTTIIKVPLKPEWKPAIETEKSIYERLGYHPGLPAVHKNENTPHLCLEPLQGSLRARLKELSGKGTALHPDLIFHWALQIARVFAHVHARHVLQVDVGCHNVLLDCDENLRLVDFAGSSIDGSEPMILPTIPLPSVAAEIFALGTLFYELETTHLPYHDKINGEQLFQSAVFPELGGLLLSRIISNCWQLRFLCMEM